MAEIETKLADLLLYDESNKKRFADLISERETIQYSQNKTEEEWLEIAERLDKTLLLTSSRYHKPYLSSRTQCFQLALSLS